MANTIYEIWFRIGDEVKITGAGMGKTKRDEKSVEDDSVVKEFEEKFLKEKKSAKIKSSIQKSTSFIQQTTSLIGNEVFASMSSNAILRGDTLRAEKLKVKQNNFNTAVGLGASAAAMAINPILGAVSLAIQLGTKALSHTKELKAYFDQVSTSAYINKLNSQTLTQNVLGDRRGPVYR